MAPSGPEGGSAEVEISRVLFSLGRETGGFEHVHSYEIGEACRVAEALECDSPGGGPNELPEVVPADAVYAHLGGDAFLVDPLLAGRRLFLCLYGSRAGRHRVLQEVAARAARELLKRVERLASVKLFSLQVALIECGLQETNSSVVLDLLGQQIVDAAGVTRESVESILRPLTHETLPNLLQLAGNRPTAALERSGHHVLQFEAGHANDAGALTIVSVADLEGEAASARRPQSAAEHLASLRRLRGVAAAFAQRGDACDPDGNPASSLVLLAPTRCQPYSSFAAVARECCRLRDERDGGALREASEEPRRRAPSFTERFCVLPSPPASERLSYDTGGSATPSAVSSPGLRSPTAIQDAPDANLGRPAARAPPQSAERPRAADGAGASLLSTAAATNCVSASSAAGCISPRHGSAAGAAADSPQDLLRALAAANVTFDAEAWLQRVRDEGRPPEQQVQDLLEVILRMQRAHGEVMEITQRMLLNWTSSTREVSVCRSLEGSQGGTANGPGAPSAEHLRWPQGLPGSATQVRVEAPGLRSSSPRLAGRPGAGILRQPLPTGPVAPGGAYAASSPRWGAKSPSELESLASGVGGSPLTRSRSANFPSGSMLSFVQRAGGALTIHGDVAVSPQVPPRDISPARSRSVMQAMSPTTVSTASAVPAPQPVAGQLRPNLVPYQLGSAGGSLLQGAVPSFPPPVQVPVTAGLALESQVVLPSPRKEHRLHLDDGVRSPLPAPPGQPPPKAADRAPHSARSGLLVGSLPVGRAGEPRPHAESWGGHGVRWDQASPCRMRVVSAAAGPGATSAPGRPVLGAPSKTGPPPAGVARVHVASMSTKSPTKSVRSQR